MIDRIRKIDRTGITTGVEHGQAQSLPEPKTSGFQELMDSASSPLLRERENVIREALKKQGINNDHETVKLLTRALAQSQLTLQWEQIEKVIFGSQVALLVELNTRGSGFSVATLRNIYDAVGKQHPKVYEGYSFEEYIDYLERTRLVAKGGDGYQITLEGKEFMVWLVQTGKTYQRPN